MPTSIDLRRPRAARAQLTAALWAVSVTGWTLLLLTDQTDAYLAAALVAAMGAIARIVIASLRRDMTVFTDVLERSNDVNANLADAATAAAFRAHADTNHNPGGAPYPLTDLEDLRPGSWSVGVYYDYVRQQVQPVGGEASNVVPITQPRRTAS